MEKQRTINNRISLEGVGLHTGKKVKIEFLPAPVNSGIFFMRKDLKPESIIKVDSYSLADPNKFPRRTSVGFNDVYIHTIEHLMAAFNLLGIDNLQINVWGEEVPGMDGSAKCFVESLQKARVQEQDAYRKYISIKEPIWVCEGNSSIIVLPYPTLRISYTLQYNNPLINTGYFDLSLNGALKSDVYEARTFCLEEEVQPLMDMNLGKGSNYENTLVVGKKEIIENSLRIENEFVKHKVLDLLGDLYLSGPIKAHVIAIKSGHGLNIRLAKKLREYYEKINTAGVGSSTGYIPAGEILSSEEIMRILPHRYPFLLVDRITHLEPNKHAVGIKNVTINDNFFQGHFPQRPVMPGVLIVEAMAQVGGVLMLVNEENRGKLAYFMAVDKVKFRRTVVPGDQLVIEVFSGRIKSRTGTVNAKAFVDGKVVAQGELRFVLVDP